MLKIGQRWKCIYDGKYWIIKITQIFSEEIEGIVVDKGSSAWDGKEIRTGLWRINPNKPSLVQQCNYTTYKYLPNQDNNIKLSK